MARRCSSRSLVKKTPIEANGKPAQLLDCKGLTSDGFDSVLANEPDSGTEPEIWHQGQRPAAFWKKHEESRKKKLHNCPANSFRI